MIAKLRPPKLNPCEMFPALPPWRRCSARHILAVNPHLAGAVIDLVDAGTEQSERIGYSSADGNFTARISSRIAFDFFDAGACRTTRQDQRSYGQQ